MRRFPVLLLLTAAVLAPGDLPGAESTPLAPYFQPDPRSVQRYGPGYRYPQAGWIVLHIEGGPYERGCQHGRLLAPEIAAHVRCFAAVQSPKAPAEGWKLTRTLVNSLFLRRYAQEYLVEMKGIADGASAAGARFDNRPLDLLDVVALNSWAEIETLNDALEATPTGLEGLRFPQEGARPKPRAKPMHCSAFAATGPATADGKVVFGHITMFSLYPSNFYNVWLDVKGTRGHRVLMQTYPGGIQSGLDYYLNDAGLLVCETTLAQTRFDSKGLTVASRIRQALQYADTIDRAVDILKQGNNGLYTNEWLLADVNTNEIALFALGTHQSKLYRSSKNEWFGETPGFYWGCNNTKDLEVRLETIASVGGRPASAVFRPSERDKTWLRLYDRYKGKIDADFGKVAFTTPPLCAAHSVDAKFTTTDMARRLETWALFGPPLGRTWKPTFAERKRFPEVRPLVGNPWAVLHARPPAGRAEGPAVVDLHDPDRGTPPADHARKEDRDPPTVPAWHGTLLPAADADVWLATAFANYERLVALENALRTRSDGQRTVADRDRLGTALFAFRADYELGSRARPERPLARTRSDLRQNDWYRVAAGKGVWVLHELRRALGAERFDKAMESFGRAHAGRPVSTAEFQAHLARETGFPAEKFLARWLHEPGLPQLKLGQVRVRPEGEEYACEVVGWVERSEAHRLGSSRQGGALPTPVEIVVETDRGEVRKGVDLGPQGTRCTVRCAGRPRRVVVDKYGLTAKSNGGPFSVLSFYDELDRTLIVHGTGDEATTLREGAEALQQALRARYSNITAPIKADREVTEDDLRTHHLLLIGRPDGNAVVARFREALPLTFGSRSFVVRGQAYAHPASAVIAAAANPANRRFAVVVIAGLSAASTLRAAPLLGSRAQRPAEVVVLPHGAAPRALVVPAKELVRDLTEVPVLKAGRAAR
jgi:hypothetical protein